MAWTFFKNGTKEKIYIEKPAASTTSPRNAEYFWKIQPNDIDGVDDTQKIIRLYHRNYGCIIMDLRPDVPDIAIWGALTVKREEHRNMGIVWVIVPQN